MGWVELAGDAAFQALALNPSPDWQIKPDEPVPHKWQKEIDAQKAGKVVQHRNAANPEWRDGHWNFDALDAEYRIKPEPVVCWSVLIQESIYGPHTISCKDRTAAVVAMRENPNTKLVKTVFDPETHEVISCTTEVS